MALPMVMSAGDKSAGETKGANSNEIKTLDELYSSDRIYAEQRSMSAYVQWRYFKNADVSEIKDWPKREKLHEKIQSRWQELIELGQFAPPRSRWCLYPKVSVHLYSDKGNSWERGLGKLSLRINCIPGLMHVHDRIMNVGSQAFEEELSTIKLEKRKVGFIEAPRVIKFFP
jgi:hypothetical protein